MKVLRGKCVFITGGAGGIGMGMARAFAAAGMKVVLADLDADRLDVAVQALSATGAQVLGLRLNVTSLEDWCAAVNEAEDTLGPIAVLCNNAGIGGGGFLFQADPELWRLVMEVNAMGPFYGCRVLLPRMLARGEEAHIVNTASLAGFRSDPGMSSYDASKHALVGMSDALRAELAGTNVGLSIVYPGMTNTGFVVNSMRVMQQDGAPPIKPDDGVHDLLKGGMDPDKVGERILRAVLSGEYHVLTHGDWKPVIEAHFAERVAAFGGNADPNYHEDIAALFSTIAASRQ